MERLVQSDVRSALFRLPTQLPDLFALFLVLTSSSVLGYLALTTAWNDITEKMFIRERTCLVLLLTQTSSVCGFGSWPISFPEPPLPLFSGTGAGGSGIILNRNQKTLVPVK